MKLVSVKTLEAKVWLLCRKIIRGLNEHKCVSCGKEVEGKHLHTGHITRKKYLPMQMKYDIRVLQNQCSYCNFNMHGNEFYYTVNVLRIYGPDFLLDLEQDIKYFKNKKMSIPETRQFLQDLIKSYTELSTGL